MAVEILHFYRILMRWSGKRLFKAESNRFQPNYFLILLAQMINQKYEVFLAYS